MKHTPGPWVAEIEDGRCMGIHAAHARDEIVTTDSGVYGPCVADAVLIAAAPEMLSALIELRAACMDAYRAGRVGAEAFVNAGNVIAKATGEER